MKKERTPKNTFRMFKKLKVGALYAIEPRDPKPESLRPGIYRIVRLLKSLHGRPAFAVYGGGDRGGWGVDWFNFKRIRGLGLRRSLKKQ